MFTAAKGVREASRRVIRFFFPSNIQSNYKVKKNICVVLLLERNREFIILCSYHSIAGVRLRSVVGGCGFPFSNSDGPTNFGRSLGLARRATDRWHAPPLRGCPAWCPT